jgi:hypothetical protein
LSCVSGGVVVAELEGTTCHLAREMLRVVVRRSGAAKKLIA